MSPPRPPAPPGLSTRSSLAWALWLGLPVLLTVMAWDGTSMDMHIQRLLGGAQGFALKDHPLWGLGLHNAGRWLAWGSLAALALWACRPVPLALAMPRAEKCWVLGTVLVSIVLISLLKRGSGTSCPWDLLEFGGSTPYIGHWRWGLSDGGPGHCFPAGHPSGMLGFLALPVFLWSRQPRRAGWLGVAIAAMGLAYGLLQMLRGAHFASHVLWTLCICWAVALASRLLWAHLQARRARRAAMLAPA